MSHSDTAARAARRQRRDAPDGAQGSLFAQQPADTAQRPDPAQQPAPVNGEARRSVRESPGAANAATPASARLVVRVLPDVVGLDKTFDYAVPDSWHRDNIAARVEVGSIVRFDLAGRRLRGWVVGVGVDPPAGVVLSPLQRLSGMGPPQDMLDLAEWAAWRWAGRRVSLLRAASPQRNIVRLPQRLRLQHPASVSAHPVYDALFAQPAATALRLPPASGHLEVARAAAARGPALIIAAGLADAAGIAADLRRRGVHVADGPDGWAAAAAGATVVGSRAAAWMPMPRIAAVAVFDEHAESLQSEQAPTWHARDVALERARRAHAPAVLASPVPSLEALAAGPLKTLGRSGERAGWARVEVFDRRLDDPVRGGLFAEGLKARLDATSGRIVAVLNRKGRGRLLACKACGELVCSSDGRVPMRLIDGGLITDDGSEQRPVLCARCGSTVLRNLRIGTARARLELAALTGEPVGEVTAQTGAMPAERVLVGTEAVLWRLPAAAAVVFLDFDNELLAARQRAASQALGMLARASHLLGGRSGGPLIVQTRQPQHPVVQAAMRADPAIVSDGESERCRELGLPPHSAQAAVSGAGGEAFADAIRSAAGSRVQVRGPLRGRYLLRADTHDTLLRVLAAVPRPAQRVRVEVDPLRV